MTTTGAAGQRSGSDPSGSPGVAALMVVLTGDYSVSAPGSTIVFGDAYAVMDVDPRTGETVRVELTKTVDLRGISLPPLAETPPGSAAARR